MNKGTIHKRRLHGEEVAQEQTIVLIGCVSRFLVFDSYKGEGSKIPKDIVDVIYQWSQSQYQCLVSPCMSFSTFFYSIIH